MEKVKIKKDDLISPLFVKEGIGVREEISSMPGIYRFSPDTITREARALSKLGIRKILVFGISGAKDSKGSSAYAEDNVVARAVRKIKEAVPELIIMTDVCLCAYTTHGHCGIIEGQGVRVKGQGKFIDNKKTLEALAKIAVSHAQAGADYVAPSAMAKGQVAAIKRALDKGGFSRTKIMGYSAKYASNFYGPFRGAALSAPAFGDRSSYQLSFSNSSQAIKEIRDDIREGADIVMVKPALSYLDIIKEASVSFAHPLAAYNVSGEYAMVKHGARLGLWDEKKIVFEIITSIKRAGADLVITYHAKDIAKWLRE